MAKKFKIKKGGSASIIVPVSVFLLTAAFFVYCVNIMEKDNGSEASEILKEAVTKAAVHCYAVEGAYPENLEYIEKNYQLNYNKDKFTVHYTSIGSNIMPDIFIVRSADDE